MSQKVRIIKVKHAGASVYLGDDSCRNHCWTRNPERITDWLCDGWRTRFNQHREHRTIRRYMEDVESHERMWWTFPWVGQRRGAVQGQRGSNPVFLARMHPLRRSRQSHARGEFGMVRRVEAQENQWRSCSGVQIPQTQPPVFRMLAQPEQDRQRRLPSGVTQAWRGRHHRKREKGIPQARRNGMPLEALHPCARQPTRQIIRAWR